MNKAAATLKDVSGWTEIESVVEFMRFTNVDEDTWCSPRPLLDRDFGRPLLDPVGCDPIYELADGRYVLLYSNWGSGSRTSSWRICGCRSSVSVSHRPGPGHHPGGSPSATPPWAQGAGMTAGTAVGPGSLMRSPKVTPDPFHQGSHALLGLPAVERLRIGVIDLHPGVVHPAQRQQIALSRLQ